MKTKLPLLILFVLLTFSVYAQPGTIDATFNPGTGATNTAGNSNVRTTSIQSDGKIIIGGQFSSYNGIARNRIARLNTDGTLDATFNPGTGANYYVSTTSIQSDGKIIIGGWFTSYNGIVRNRIARLNTDGTLDATFDQGTGADNVVSTTSIQSDGKIIIGGNFTSYNGIAINRIARLNTNGTLDTSFNPGTGANGYGVGTTSIQSDGKIIIGGAFTSYNDIARNSIARINGGNELNTSDFEKNNIVIYPNPTHSVLNLSVNEGISLDKVTIVDSTGKVVLEQNENLTSINVEKLAKGVYILTAYSEGGKYQEKFIKE